MKGIVVELGKMKIPLKPYAKPIRQRPYKIESEVQGKSESKA
jgi:hypothetical protein